MQERSQRDCLLVKSYKRTNDGNVGGDEYLKEAIELKKILSSILEKSNKFGYEI